MSQVRGYVNMKTEANRLTGDSLKIEINKKVNKTEAKVKDNLTYTVLVTNMDPVDAQNTILKDILPKELKFVPGSVFVDGVPQSSVNVNHGIKLGMVGTGELIEVTFQAQVINIPPDELVKNKATLNYEFESAPGLPIKKGEVASNITETKVIVRPPTNCENNQSNIEFSIKQEEKAIAELLDAEAEKIQAANQALNNGRITKDEHNLIIQSENGVSQALSTLKQELQNKRNTIQDLCSGCK
ncbi:DUF11 domain-containing protein [Bacillus pseudomycoides]|uniref:DUF11 domain-containing protein n=1 Tax=Bacillus pseudomycoides TaxID=64104 RepID=UPI000BF82A02|nr:DUF11 domain-containing protein [Bacillus pseudomycoides]PEP56617.1 hypothetical protein CN564_16545 [Bacillus pseudomycoides]PHC80756.1 hypothetical protein COF36_28710 [Bacillus pseudomycoides]